MDAREFYDRMATDYHLISTGWAGSSERQGQLIEGLLQGALRQPGPFRVLDCACGVGTQALGLARLGHALVASDISAVAVQKARTEAQKAGLQLEFQVADMRALEGISGPFDAVVCFDNSLAHLSEKADLAFALSSILSVLRPGGVFLASLRDYDQLRLERPTGTLPRRIVDALGERVYVQTWDWSDDLRSYDLRLFVLKRNGENWSARPLETRMRAFTRGELSEEAEKTGFASGEWLFQGSTGYYQPIFAARKA